MELMTTTTFAATSGALQAALVVSGIRPCVTWTGVETGIERPGTDHGFPKRALPMDVLRPWRGPLA